MSTHLLLPRPRLGFEFPPFVSSLHVCIHRPTLPRALLRLDPRLLLRAQTTCSVIRMLVSSHPTSSHLVSSHPTSSHLVSSALLTHVHVHMIRHDTIRPTVTEGLTTDCITSTRHARTQVIPDTWPWTHLLTFTFMYSLCSHRRHRHSHSYLPTYWQLYHPGVRRHAFIQSIHTGSLSSSAMRETLDNVLDHGPMQCQFQCSSRRIEVKSESRGLTNEHRLAALSSRHPSTQTWEVHCGKQHELRRFAAISHALDARRRTKDRAGRTVTCAGQQKVMTRRGKRATHDTKRRSLSAPARAHGQQQGREENASSK